MKFFILLFLFFSQSIQAASWNGRIFRAVDTTEITNDEFLAEARASRLIVMGENHVTPEVQNAEAKIIKEVVTSHNLTFALAWEFLAYNQQTLVNELWEKFENQTLSGEEFIRLTLGNPVNNTYIPVLQAVASQGGKLFGINLSREEKAPVTKGGIKAADPRIIPPNYESGGADYWQRFKDLMGDHTTPDKLTNYFDAQCLTDDVMAHEVSRISGFDKIFMIAGHFHTDYFDGFVNRLHKRLPGDSKLIIRIIDASEFTEDQLLKELMHPKFGQLADFAYFVKEPIAAAKKSY